MSKKTQAVKSVPPKQPDKQKKSSGQGSSDKQKTWIALGILAVITFFIFSPSDNVEFTNWDDGTYVSENPMIWKLDAKAIKEIFTTPVSLNYHPLTMLSLAINYSYSGLHAKPYVITNNIIHILNVFLVFFFIRMLVIRYNRLATSGWKADPFNISLIVTALLALHPMRVEIVTWIAERKDVLYVFFFVLSMIYYLKWADNKKSLPAALCFVFFICSCLSKGMGVVLPVVLVLLDWFLGDAKTIRQVSRSIITKAHFFVAAMVFGIVAFKIQSQGAIAAMETFTLFPRLPFGCSGCFLYI